MKTELVMDTSLARRTLLTLCQWGEEIRLAYAWVSARGDPSAHWDALPIEKITRAVVGLHFDRTDPDVLRALHQHDAPLRVWTHFDGVFHPKVFVAVRGSSARVLIGSSNFTSGGFGANVEANILLTGQTNERPIAALIAGIDRWWHRGAKVTDEWLGAYEVRYRDRARLEHKWRNDHDVAEPNDDLPIDLDLSWSAFLKRLRTLSTNAQFDVLGGSADDYYSAVAQAERCHRPFERHARFRDISPEERRVIGGYGRDETGWFGPIRHRGVMRWLRDEGNEIGKKLDRVPLTGSAQQVIGPARRFLEWALEQPYVSIGSASRLLMGKRPDLFVCLNAANATRVHDQFEVRVRDAPDYLDLHDRIWRLAWHRSPRPKDPVERRVWKLRAALLDALLFDDAPPIPRASRGVKPRK